MADVLNYARYIIIMKIKIARREEKIKSYVKVIRNVSVALRNVYIHIRIINYGIVRHSMRYLKLYITIITIIL